jgi:hypothetical protein
MRIRSFTGALLVTLAVIGAGGAAGAAPDPPPADSTGTGGAAAADSAAAESTAADSTAALDNYLRQLEDRTQQDFLLEELSISDTEVDSLLLDWQRNGVPEAPAGATRPDRWRLERELGGVRYNRVEGLNLMPELTLRPPRWPAAAFGRVGYGWASRKWTWRGGVGGTLPLRGRPTLEIEHAREVYAYGAGGLPGNSMIALFTGRDYDDYFLGEGWTARLGLQGARAAAKLRWREENQSSLERRAELTLFEGDRAFRPNPAIDDGTLRALDLGLVLGNPSVDRLGGTLNVATAGGPLGGRFDYERYRGEVIGRQRLWLGDEIRARLTAGHVEGDVPYQALHHVGGTRLLRGYEINEIPARQFTALSLDYKVGTNILGYVPWVRRLRLQPVPFFDAAAVFETQREDGTPVRLRDPEWRFSAGVGIQQNILGIPGGSGQVRLDVARRLDRADDTMTYRLGFTVER